jgi:hypothetical protein
MSSSGQGCRVPSIDVESADALCSASVFSGHVLDIDFSLPPLSLHDERNSADPGGAPLSAAQRKSFHEVHHVHHQKLIQCDSYGQRR